MYLSWYIRRHNLYKQNKVCQNLDGEIYRIITKLNTDSYGYFTDTSTELIPIK